MTNIKFNYLYRDAGNYKTYGSVVFSNAEGLSVSEINQQLKQHLIDSEFFDPKKLSIPCLQKNHFDYDEGMDHEWNEYCSVEMTNAVSSHELSIREFLSMLSEPIRRSF